jgi:hypothetical protein
VTDFQRFFVFSWPRIEFHASDELKITSGGDLADFFLADFFLVDFFLADFFQVRKLLTILLIR